MSSSSPNKKSILKTSDSGKSFVLDDAAALEFKPKLSNIITSSSLDDDTFVTVSLTSPPLDITPVNVNRKITLRCSDGKSLQVEEAVAFESPTIKQQVEHDRVVLLPNVSSRILAKVIEYCSKHVGNPQSDAGIKNWDADFVKEDQTTLLELILAANYLKINSLTDLTCRALDVARNKNRGDKGGVQK